MRFSFTNFVRQEEASRLPHRLRIAWAASVYDTVLYLYSPYFRQRFLQQEALEMAWQYAVDGHVVEPRRTELFQRMKDLIPSAEEEGYGNYAVFTGMLLLTDVALDKAQDSVAAVGDAAVMFAAHYAHRQGVSSFDRTVPYEYLAELSMPVYRFARTLYDEALRQKDRVIGPGMFGALRPEPPTLRLSPAILAKARRKPPVNEPEFIREQGWAWERH